MLMMRPRTLEMLSRSYYYDENSEPHQTDQGSVLAKIERTFPEYPTCRLTITRTLDLEQILDMIDALINECKPSMTNGMDGPGGR